MSKQWVYYFGDKGKEAKMLLGGKGANLSEMTKMGLPIPSGFTLSTECCIQYQEEKDSQWPAGLGRELDAAVAKLEKISGKKFGDVNNPLLVSVRSGAAISMPGMMDTVLNLGLNDEIVKAIGKRTNERFAYDAYRRFIQMFGDVVMGVKRVKFEHVLDKIKAQQGVQHDTDLTAADLKQLVKEYFVLYQREVGTPFPTDAVEQLKLSINAVFDSWNNPRAIVYRDMMLIPHNIGTAVNIQEMVFGNMGNDCATGVAFTRNPSTGENKRYGEYLANAQGEDVVAGIRTPKDLNTMKHEFPKCAAQLFEIFETLENHYRDMQDIEFTIEKHKLFILQTRTGKRTAAAALNMAVDMAEAGFINKETAIMRVDPEHLETLMHKQLDPSAVKSSKHVTKGLPASPGAGVGQVVFTAEQAVEAKEAGMSVILVRLETSPEDITGMQAAQGILTARGGMTSHAAVVARGMNICCICGVSDITVNEAGGYFTAGKKRFNKGDWISLDGSTGKFYEGKMAVVDPELGGNFTKILDWASEFCMLDVMANADTPKDALVAKNFGAQGIGLCRTEHMFFNPERILAVREMILANETAGRVRALDKLLPFQRSDFHGILGAMSGLPVIIRLIDPPLHEFLPHEEKDQAELAAVLGVPTAEITAKVDALHEFNPMLGFRGCRLGVVYPEINAMQVRAIFEAALQLQAEGKDPKPLIEVPLVGNLKEFLPLKQMVRKIALETGAEGKVKYEVGTMIEVPRAALTADELATEAEFMSFGTNDLTQMTCGFSRDDSGSFLKHYVQQKIYKRDPFQSVDQDGVGKLMQVCVALARSVNPTIDIGICGEHGGEPNSVEFCHKIGMSNVSCSPYRVPIAKLAAAQAAIKHGKGKVASISQIFQSKL